MHLFALIYGLFYVKEPAIYDHLPKKQLEEGKSVMVDFFNKEHIMETFKVAFKNGANKRRLRVIMLIIVVIVVDGPLHGKYI